MVLGLYLTKGLVRYKGKYLLLKKVKDIIPDNNGKWECPRGKIAERDDPQDTLLREIDEETGLKCKIVKELPILQMRNEKYDSVCRVYLLEALSDKVILSEEHSEYKWLKPEEVKNMELVMFADLLLKYFNHAEKLSVSGMLGNDRHFRHPKNLRFFRMIETQCVSHHVKEYGL